MEKYDFTCFEDIMRACGYDIDEDGNCKYCESMYDGEDDDSIGCNDMTGGFQNIYPQLFVLVGEIVGSIVSEKLPINVQNSFGNWLQLIGQVILTYNAQQQYFQGGPGRLFNPKYYNVSNPFCNTTKDYMPDGEEKDYKKGSGNSNKKNKSLEREIYNLKSEINELRKEINKLKKDD